MTLRVVFLLTIVLAVSWAGPALAVNRVDLGFDEQELIRRSGAGPDPGPQDPGGRLLWAVQLGVPAEWSQAVSVRWRVGDAGRGHLAISRAGSVVVSARALSGSAEAAVSTVAHEMGHQIALQKIPPYNGFPPLEFIDRAAGRYRDVREGWADCVRRVWTGSLRHTLSEAAGCDSSLAHYAATLLSDPRKLAALLPPPVVASPKPSPSASPSPSPSPSPEFSPVRHPLMADYLEPTPEASPAPKTVATQVPDRVPDGLFVIIGLAVLAVVIPLRRLSRVPNDKLLAWASAAGGPSLVKRLREKISRDL